MKKILAIIICLAALISLFVGCGSANEPQRSDKIELENIVDYTILNDPYGTILEFMANPADYQGQNIKVSALGSVIYNFDQNKVERHVMLGLDPTGCCNSSYEVRAKDGKYPTNGSEVTFIGTFTSDGYIDLYDWTSKAQGAAQYEIDALSMSANELEAFITEYSENYMESNSLGNKIRIFGHLINQSGYAYLLGLDGNGYQTFAIELHDGSNTISFPVVSGNIVNPVEVIGTLSFYFEGDIPYACIEVDEVNKVECVFK